MEVNTSRTTHLGIACERPYCFMTATSDDGAPPVRPAQTDLSQSNRQVDQSLDKAMALTHSLCKFMHIHTNTSQCTAVITSLLCPSNPTSCSHKCYKLFTFLHRIRWILCCYLCSTGNI